MGFTKIVGPRKTPT